MKKVTFILIILFFFVGCKPKVYNQYVMDLEYINGRIVRDTLCLPNDTKFRIKTDRGSYYLVAEKNCDNTAKWSQIYNTVPGVIRYKLIKKY